MITVYEKLKGFWWGSIRRLHPKLFEHTFRYRMYIKYIISGGSAAGINLFFTAFFVELVHLHYIISSVLSFCLGFVASFLLQKFFTFGHTGMSMVHRQLIIYFTIALANLGLNTLLVFIFVDVLGIWYLFSQALASILIAITSFVLYRKFVFTRSS